NRDIIVFGTGALSSLAWYCITHDTSYRVVAFTLDTEYMSEPIHEGLPTVAFEKIEDHYPPNTVQLVIPLGFHAINGLRKERYQEAISKGYELIQYVSSQAKTWPDLQLGTNSLIYEGTIIQPFSRIGNNVIIRSGAHISHHCVVADHAFVAAGVTLGGNVKIGKRAFLGLGAVVRDGINIAERSFIGAGAVVISDTEPDGVYVGNPARKLSRSSLEVTVGLSAQD
ncbi:MAG: acetyltransferase, partial [Candidatus Heimdallarchaeota archaeon]|nr:acetyltransferase [Candidatus Heimdallarchaeota archaeon]